MHIELAFLIIYSIDNNLTNTFTWSKRTVLFVVNLILLCTSTGTSINWKFKDKIFNFFEAPDKQSCCDNVLRKFLPVLIFFFSFFFFGRGRGVEGGVNRVSKCNKLAVHFKLTLEMVLVVLYKYLNCAVDKTIDTGYTTVLALL